MNQYPDNTTEFKAGDHVKAGDVISGVIQKIDHKPWGGYAYLPVGDGTYKAVPLFSLELVKED